MNVESLYVGKAYEVSFRRPSRTVREIDESTARSKQEPTRHED